MSGIHYLQTKRGLFTETTQEGQRHYSYTEVSGHLVNITFKQTEFGNIMKLHLIDADNYFVISMFINSRPATAFLMLVPSFNLKNEITLSITRQGGLDYLRAFQFGYPVGWYKRFPGYGDLLPKDNQERISYLLNYVKTEIIPILAHLVCPYSYHPTYKPTGQPDQQGYFDEYKTKGNTQLKVLSQADNVSTSSDRNESNYEN